MWLTACGGGDESKLAHQRVLDQGFHSHGTRRPAGGCYCQCSNHIASQDCGVAQQKLWPLLLRTGFSPDEMFEKVASQLLSSHQVAYPAKRT